MNGTVQSDQSQNLWQTPKRDKPFGTSNITLNILIKEFDLQLDPCATNKTDSMCKKHFTKNTDGLSKEWLENTIFNPPFSIPVIENGKHKTTIDKNGEEKLCYKSAIGLWVEKALQQSILHKTVVIGILPVYTSTKWFHEYVDGIAQVIFIKGRIHFIHPSGKTGSPNFDSMLVIWDARKKINVLAKLENIEDE